MATYHLTVKAGAKGKAAPHAEYISREGKYSGRDRYEDLEATAYGNMPKWAEQNPAHFWEASDQNERANGTAYREIEIALPRELNPKQRRELVEEFVSQTLGDKHAYQWAIHTPKAALEKGEQPHAHIMYSERRRDDIERDPSHYFKRYNAKNPEKGGNQKGDSGGTKTERNEKRKAELLALRESWATLQNKHLERHGCAVVVDHRSLKDQGSDRTAEKHLGGSGVRQLDAGSISALLEYRAAEGERERAQGELSSIIDLASDLAAAKKASEVKLQAEPEKVAAKVKRKSSVLLLADALFLEQKAKKAESIKEANLSRDTKPAPNVVAQAAPVELPTPAPVKEVPTPKKPVEPEKPHEYITPEKLTKQYEEMPIKEAIEVFNGLAKVVSRDEIHSTLTRRVYEWNKQQAEQAKTLAKGIEPATKQVDSVQIAADVERLKKAHFDELRSKPDFAKYNSDELSKIAYYRAMVDAREQHSSAEKRLGTFKNFDEAMKDPENIKALPEQKVPQQTVTPKARSIKGNDYSNEH